MLTLAWVGERRRPDLGQVFWPDRGFSKGRAQAGDCKESAASSRYYCGRDANWPGEGGTRVTNEADKFVDLATTTDRDGHSRDNRDKGEFSKWL